MESAASSLSLSPGVSFCWGRNIAWWLNILLLLALGAAGCARPVGPALLKLEQVGPGLLEDGVELKVHGEGFPDRREAQVFLQGRLFSPGREPRAVRWRLSGEALSSAALRVRLNQAKLLQMTEGAGHGTFRGRVHVRFEPQRAGAPALFGESDPVVLDLVPRSGGNALAAGRFGAYLGLSLDDHLQVSGVVPESEAARAGLQLGDRVAELDGVRLLSPHEFIPAPRGVESRLLIAREGYAGLAEMPVARQGYWALDPALAWRAVLAVFAVSLGLLLWARPPRLLVWLFRPRSARERGGSELASSASMLLLSCALAFVWGLLRLPVAGDFDLVLLSSAGGTMFVLAGFLAGGRSSSGRYSFSLVGAVAGGLSAGLHVLPLLCATVLCATDVGSLRLVDVLRVQDVSPGSWTLMQSPWMALLALFSLVALVPRAGRRPPCAEVQRQGRAFGLSEVTEQLGTYSLLGLWVVLFAGGTAGYSPDSWQAGALLGLKLSAVATLVIVARARLGQLRRGEGWSLLGGRVLLGSLLLFVLGLTASSLLPLAGFEEPLRGFSLWLIVALAILPPLTALRSLAHHGRRADPWI